MNNKLSVPLNNDRHKALETKELPKSRSMKTSNMIKRIHKNSNQKSDVGYGNAFRNDVQHMQLDSDKSKALHLTFSSGQLSAKFIL